MSRPKEEFSSYNDEAYISLGTFKNNTHNPCKTYNSSFIHHSIPNGENNPVFLKTRINSASNYGTLLNSNTVQNENKITWSENKFNNASLTETKFHKGFHRRPKDSMDFSLEKELQQKVDQANAIREIRMQKTAEIRAERLNSLNNRTGYNILTNQDLERPPTSTYVPYNTTKSNFSLTSTMNNTKKHDENCGLSNEAPRRGHLMMLDSNNRFFTPYPSGKAIENRQHTLIKEGVYRERLTSIINSGNVKDYLPTTGIDDQFGNSSYINQKLKVSTLFDTKVAGKYTPRKQINNPAANKDIIKVWNSKIDIANRTMRNQV